LYLWHLADTFDLLNDLKETLSEDLQATGAQAPPTASRRKEKRKRKRTPGGSFGGDSVTAPSTSDFGSASRLEHNQHQERLKTQQMFMETFQNLGMKQELTSIRNTIASLGQREAAFQTQLLGLNREKRQAPEDQKIFIQEDIDVVMQSKVEVRNQIERYQQEEARVEATIRQLEETFRPRSHHLVTTIPGRRNGADNSDSDSNASSSSYSPSSGENAF